MDKVTQQMEQWAGSFGKEYTDRNILPPEGLEQLCKANYGLTRTEMNQLFLGSLDRNIRVLEVGSNVGNQLICLQNMGFKNLYGIELQPYAVELSKNRTKDINIIQGSAFDIPYKDSFFDLVFTSGVLIHIAPGDMPVVMDEMHRCSKRYIWGLEYYSQNHIQKDYRGHTDLLWKGDFCQLFLTRFQDLKAVKQQLFKYTTNENMDAMYFLEKNHRQRA